MDFPKLDRPPIIEAILDIDCEMKPGFDLRSCETRLRAAYLDKFPVLRIFSLDQHKITAGSTAAPVIASTPGVLQGYHFGQNDQKQFVQAKIHGFTFNRLAPYASLDDYLPAIEGAWKLYQAITAPIVIQAIRLRYINRILIPVDGQQVKFEEYFQKCLSRLPGDEQFEFGGFLIQQMAFEKATGHQVNVVFASQEPEAMGVPVIFDIATMCSGAIAIDDWQTINDKIISLRRLKNLTFYNSLTEKCLGLFQNR